MSILRKIPKIEQVLDNMSIESLKRLESLMNSGNGATETYTLFGGENKLNYVNKDLGVWYCNIELERNKSVETGFLIWESSTKALFISFDITQCLKEYEIDLTNYSYTKINEKLSIEEFRRVLEDNINKEVVHIDTSGNVEIGKNLVVDGKVILNGKEDLVDTSGNELISGSSGGGDIWLDIAPYMNEGMTAISQEGYNLLYNGIMINNKYCGITVGEKHYLYYMEYVGNLFFEYKEADENAKSYLVGIYQDLHTVYMENPFINKSGGLTFPTTSPSSQVIPSITTSNTQQNLTVGDGLTVENGVLKIKEVESTEFVCANYGFQMKGISEVNAGVDVGKGIITTNTDVINKATQFINLFSSKESFSKHKCSISIEIDSLGLYTEVANLYPVKSGNKIELYATIYLFGNAYADIFIDSLNNFHIQFIYIEPTESKLTQLGQIMTALATSGKITFNILKL